MIMIISILLLAALDQYSKFLALERLKPIGNITVIPNWFDLTFVENRGAAFGILQGQVWFFILITIAVTVFAIYYIRKMQGNDKVHNWMKVSIVLILAGAWGNAIDRILKGYVVDYFEFTFISYPVFNVADIYVVMGTILMTVLILFFWDDKDKNAKKE